MGQTQPFDGGGSTAMPDECTLDEGERETWRALMLLITTLPTAFDTQLQRDSGLSLLEYTVMAHLSSRPDRTARLSDLARHGNCERSRLSHLLTRLEARGFVARSADPDDGRHMRATLTEAGRAHLADAVPGHINLVRSLIFNRLDATEQHFLREIAHRILNEPPAASSRPA